MALLQAAHPQIAEGERLSLLGATCSTWLGPSILRCRGALDEYSCLDFHLVFGVGALIRIYIVARTTMTLSGRQDGLPRYFTATCAPLSCVCFDCLRRELGSTHRSAQLAPLWRPCLGSCVAVKYVGRRCRHGLAASRESAWIRILSTLLFTAFICD